MSVAELVTVVVSPRDHFSHALRSLEALLATTPTCRLIYVAGRLPGEVEQQISREAEAGRLEIVRAPRYPSPTHARNLGARMVTTKYVLFTDNDTLFRAGWLEALVGCAEETNAGIVGPLYFIGELEREIVHMAGGTGFFNESSEGRTAVFAHRFMNKRLAKVPALRRMPVVYVEFHCMLVRMDLLARIGFLDEDMSSLHEHIDVCLAARRTGASVYFEPGARMTYISPPPCAWYDLPFFTLRWCESWNLRSISRFNAKWGVHDADLAHNDYVRWARGRRRLGSEGVRVEREQLVGLADGSLFEAELVVSAFQSIGVNRFIVRNGNEVELSEEDLLQRLPELTGRKEPWSIRPHQPDGPRVLAVTGLQGALQVALEQESFLVSEDQDRKRTCFLALGPEDGSEIVRAGLGSAQDRMADGSSRMVTITGGRSTSLEKLRANGLIDALHTAGYHQGVNDAD